MVGWEAYCWAEAFGRVLQAGVGLRFYCIFLVHGVAAGADLMQICERNCWVVGILAVLLKRTRIRFVEDTSACMIGCSRHRDAYSCGIADVESS